MTLSRERQPLSVAGALRITGASRLDRPLAGTADRLLGLARLDALYQALPACADAGDFIARALTVLDVDCEVDPRELESVPIRGPVVVVANHPFGAIEGLLLAHLLLQRRGDVRVLANGLLGRVVELRDLVLAVNPFEGPAAARDNIAPLRSALRWLRHGGLLAMFPAGEVAHLRLRERRVCDPPWRDSAAYLARAAGATVVPVHFSGRNGCLFQILGLLHPRLRTALLARELANKRGARIEVHIGTPASAAELHRFDGPPAITRFLRLRTEALARQPRPPVPARAIAPRLRRRASAPAAVAAAPAAALLHAEIAALPEEQTLVRSGSMRVLYAEAAQIHWVLREIGRLREISFRAAGEGSGKALDLDLFDGHYHQLLVWDDAHQWIAGAYRFALVDTVLARHGKRGLYTQSLFRYRRRFVAGLGCSIELGRSFVRPECQKNHSPLLLLWKGIGTFIARHPQYRYLFGPVSISNEYHPLSRQVLVEFLTATSFHPRLARMVRPRRGFRRPGGTPWRGADLASLHDISAVDALLADLEQHRRGVPVLLRQYLKLGGLLLGFNVDPAFADALDGLILVDLTRTDARILERYMGVEGAAAWRAHHRAGALARAG